jgi:hypothetical protein
MFHHHLKHTGRITDPVVDIKANGSDGPVFVTIGDPVSITISVQAGAYTGLNADWWIVVNTSFGWFSYVHPIGWVPGIRLAVQGPLFNFSPPLEVLNMVLPSADYVFYFVLDDNANGVPDATWFDWVGVRVQP